MNTYQFYVYDDPELYHQEAESLEQARAEICNNFEITVDQIENIAEVKPDMTLSDLQLHIENMYDQLDPDTIDSWPVDGLEVVVDGVKFAIRVEQI